MLQAADEIRRKTWETIEGLTDEQLNRKIDEKTWSIMQVLEHLFLFERGILWQFKRCLEEPEDSPAEQKDISRTLDRSIHVTPPDPLIPSDEFRTRAEMEEKLASARERMRAWLDSLEDKSILHRRSFRHPTYGPVSIYQWVELISIHEQRHLMQIQDIKQAVLQQTIG